MRHKRKPTIIEKKDPWQGKIGLIVGILFILVLIILGFAFFQPEESISFGFADNTGQWQLSEGSSSARLGDAVQLTKGGDQLYVIIPQINVDADYYDVCVIEGAWPIAYDQGHLLFISPFNKSFDFNFRYDFDTGTAKREHKRYIDLPAHGAWQGMVKAVLIIPATNAKQVSLKEIKFSHANLWTRTKAWWSDFTRYSDPLLGTCFAMATPVFMGQPFNPFFVPILLALLVLGLIIAAGVHLFKADRKIAQIGAGVCLAVILLAWGLLDLRNNVVYFKAIFRNVSLYWGKSTLEKREIVVGDPEFIDFMKFCDDNIPLNGKIFNCVPVRLPNTPENYLAAVQFYFNLRPRCPDLATGKLTGPYYIYYKPEQEKVGQLIEEQVSFSGFLELAPGGKISQEIKLKQASNELVQINVWLRGKDSNKDSIELLLLDKDKKTIAGKGEYLSRDNEEVFYRFVSLRNYNKGTTMLLQVSNKDNHSLGVGYYGYSKYNDGSVFRDDQQLAGEMPFRMMYRSNSLKLYKRFNDDAFILTE
jgi:hypothetical protein